MKEEIKTSTKKRIKIANIIFWVVLAIVAIYSVVALTSNNDGITSIFGKTALTVQTDSMAPTFESGDLIYVNTEFDAKLINIDDVITYKALIDVNGDGESEWVYNSHRVVSIEEDVTGYLHFVTKGDNNLAVDYEPVHEKHVVAIWTGRSVSNLGGFIDGLVGFLRSGTGFFIFIVLPCFAFLVYEVIKFVNVMSEYKTEQALAGRDKLREEAIALARKQLEEEAKQKAQEEKEEAKTE